MATVIKRGSTKEAITKSLQELDKKTSKGFTASKFCGTLKLQEDALAIQKRLRDEWG